LARVALIGADLEQGAGLARTLEAAGFACWPLRSAEEAARVFGRETFDLVLIHGAGEPGAAANLVRQVRLGPAAAAPLLVIAPQAEEADIAATLEAGADDCLSETPGAAVLLARVRAALRRAAPAGDLRMVWRVGDYEIDPAQRAIRLGGREVTLTRKEFALAELLFANVGRPLSRAYALEAVWGRNPALSTRTLDTHVSRVRNKLRLTPEHGMRLATVYSYGYQLDLLKG
jgi:DNA-binding response OmpR family regulator